MSDQSLREERERIVSLLFDAQHFAFQIAPGARYHEVLDALKLCVWQPDKRFAEAITGIVAMREKEEKGAV